MSASREKKMRKQENITGSSKEEQAGLSSFQKAVIAVVSVIVVLFVAAAIILGSGVIQQWTTAVTVGGENISVAEYNYYYVNTVNQTLSNYQNTGYSLSDLGFDTSKPFNQQTYTSGSGTWDDQFKASTNSTLQTVFAYYNAAKAAGYELTQADKDAVELELKDLEEYVAELGTSLGVYLRSTYGKGISKDNIREYMLRGKLSESYQQYLQDQITYTEEELQAYYEAHKDDIDVVDYRAFMIDGSNQTEHPEDYEYADGEEVAEKEAAMAAARAQADLALAALTDLDSFTQVASTYCDEDNKERYSDPANSTYTNAQYSTLISVLADWLFEDGRAQGDKAVLESGTNVIVVMFDQRYREEYRLKNVRHILVQDADGQQISALSEEEKAALKQQAEDILQEWKAGEATEESFAKLADEKSADSPEGGLYENVYIGQMVTPFEDWVFDASRQPGDTGIVETTYGYHVMYFVGDGDISWKADAAANLRSEAVSAQTKEYQESYPISGNDFGLSMVGGQTLAG